MSFARAETFDPKAARVRVGEHLTLALESLANAAQSQIAGGRRRVIRGDSREVAKLVGARRYGAVITSPPYSNRMSYIRELRPYMYWLGYLGDGRAAGELDWRAIGGTWGIATSNLKDWEPPPGVEVPYRRFPAMVRRIAAHSPLLARYVVRYFCDMAAHFESLRPVIAPGGELHYIVGNSKFYDVLLPAQEILARQMRAAGFAGARAVTLRKRTSKRELYEYRVSARAP